jgi:plasmid stability protein
MSEPTQDDLDQLRRALADTLATIERVRAAAGGSAAEALELPEVVRSDRPGESIPMLEQDAADLRRDIRALEVELARRR